MQSLKTTQWKLIEAMCRFHSQLKMADKTWSSTTCMLTSFYDLSISKEGIFLRNTLKSKMYISRVWVNIECCTWSRDRFSLMEGVAAGKEKLQLLIFKGMSIFYRIWFLNIRITRSIKVRISCLLFLGPLGSDWIKGNNIRRFWQTDVKNLIGRKKLGIKFVTFLSLFPHTLLAVLKIKFIFSEERIEWM